MLKKFKGLLVEEQGQGMTEYGLILGAIAIAVVAAIALLGPRLLSMFDNSLDSVIPGDPPAAN